MPPESRMNSWELHYIAVYQVFRVFTNYLTNHLSNLYYNVYTIYIYRKRECDKQICEKLNPRMVPKKIHRILYNGSKWSDTFIIHFKSFSVSHDSEHFFFPILRHVLVLKYKEYEYSFYDNEEKFISTNFPYLNSYWG